MAKFDLADIDHNNRMDGISSSFFGMGGTKTIDDLADSRLWQHPSLPPHQLEKLAGIGHLSDKEMPVQALSTTGDHLDDPIACVHVWMDDLIGLAQGTHLKTLVSCAVLHSIDDAFRPVELSDNPKHPLIVKLPPGPSQGASCLHSMDTKKGFPSRNGTRCWGTLFHDDCVTGQQGALQCLTIAFSVQQIKNLCHHTGARLPRQLPMACLTLREQTNVHA